MQELVGKTLDRYQMLSLLGEGGMGAVFKAKDLTLQRSVAIKIMHPQFARQGQFQDRFLQEARVAASLDHPGIVKVFDFGSKQGMLYIVMEFIPGANLRKLLEDLSAARKRILLPEAVELIREVALALHYAHTKGVLHRDIKPDNIMLKPEPAGALPYRPVITDLGLAKLAEGGLRTDDGTSMGTPAYMSPEQALGRPTDPRSDVYSLGVLLFELATGQRPFPARNLAEAMHYHGEVLPPQPRSIRPDLPPALEAAILRTLEKDPARRYPDAAAFAQALSTVLQAALTEKTPLGEATAASPGGAVASPGDSTGAVSLHTEYQKSLVEPRGPSIFAEFKTPPGGPPAQDFVQVLSPGQPARSLPFKTGSLTIGRENDNDLVLEDPKASRHHARIEYDGQTYKVLDLNSSNGTYVDNARLLPGIAEPWTPEKALRIGGTWLRLVRGAVSAKKGAQSGPALSGPVVSGARFTRADGTQVESSQIYTSTGQGAVAVCIDTLQVVVEPGGSQTIPMILLNQSAIVDHFEVGVEGIPAGWVRPPLPRVQLLPGDQQEASLTLQPPRQPQSRAGRYPLTVRVKSTENDDQFVEVKLSLTVTAYTQYSVDMQPQKLSEGRKSRISIENKGNSQETFQVRWKDRADELVFRPPQAQANVPQGQVGLVDFKVVPRRARWFGGEKTHAFTASVGLAQGDPQVLSGEFVSQGRLPAWVLTVPPVLCLLLFALGAALFGYSRSQATKATQTAQAVAFSLQQTLDSASAAGTQAFQAASQATGAAGTAMAGTALAQGDDDQDGLSNVKELSLGTDPHNPDTDGDGLLDGLEVNTLATDPKNQDTDGDTVPDGKEVNELKTSPINKDTDGDGLNDNVDPSPLSLPTPTPQPSATALPSATPTPTPPVGGISLNCDGTYQRFRLVDNGANGRTAFLDAWTGTNYQNIWSFAGGDPNIRQIETQNTGPQQFGDCQKLIVLPLRNSGSGAILELHVFGWDGTNVVEIFKDDGVGGTWTHEGKKLTLERSVYLFGEPNAAPCNRETVVYQWDGVQFQEVEQHLTPTFQGAPPPECGGPTATPPAPIPTFPIFILRTPIFVLPLQIATPTPP